MNTTNNFNIMYDELCVIELLNKEYNRNPNLFDYSAPVIKIAHFVELLLQELSRINNIEENPHPSYIYNFANSDNKLIPNEYKRFLNVIRLNRNIAAHGHVTSINEMMEFTNAFKCFTCWYFESFDIFGKDEESKNKILSKVDVIENELGSPIEANYIKNSNGNYTRLLMYKAKIAESINPYEKNIDLQKGSEDYKKELNLFFSTKLESINNKLEQLQKTQEKTNEKLDSITVLLNELKDQISSYQDLVKKQIDLALTEDEIDRIIHAYSEECIEKIINGVDERYTNKTREDEERRLIDSLGKDIWSNKLSSSSRNYLISSKVTYKYYNNNELLDYSGVCLLVTKALEVEMSERFYKQYVAFLKQRFSDSWKKHLDEFPTTLIKKINGAKVLKSNKDFTLGAVPFVLCAKDDKNATDEQIKNNKKCLVEFAKNGLIIGKTDEEILNILSFYGNRINDITEDYRNKAAHTNELGKVDAETCFKIVLDTEQLLKKMLDTFEF